MEERDDVDAEVKEKWMKIQKELKEGLITKDIFNSKEIKLVGGVDISFGKDNFGVACLVVLSYPELKVVHTMYKDFYLSQPYIPGFLAFRESPVLEEMVATLKKDFRKFLPDVILVDGCGIWHPREFGLASQLGVCAFIPTIGVSKKLLSVDGWTRLTDYEKIKATLKNFGDSMKIVGKTNGKEYGVAFRGKSINPLFVSIGHGVSLETAVDVVKNCCKYKIPEPIRQADLKGRDKIRKMEAKKK